MNGYAVLSLIWIIEKVPLHLPSAPLPLPRRLGRSSESSIKSYRELRENLSNANLDFIVSGIYRVFLVSVFCSKLCDAIAFFSGNELPFKYIKSVPSLKLQLLQFITCKHLPPLSLPVDLQVTPTNNFPPKNSISINRKN